jgi:hypothetical protein
VGRLVDRREIVDRGGTHNLEWRSTCLFHNHARLEND